MKLRAPAIPLVAVDPYFSIWSTEDRLNTGTTRHWTGKPNPMVGVASVDGEEYVFMGLASDIGKGDTKAMEQIGLEINALSTTYRFRGGNVELTAAFTTPLLPDDLTLLSRPVSYLRVTAAPLDGKDHDISVTLFVTEAICLDHAGDLPVKTEPVALDGPLSCARIGSVKQDVLGRKGDDIRIDWGYFYLAADGGAKAEAFSFPAEKGTQQGLRADGVVGEGLTFLLAYDDIESIEYFGEHLKAYWKKDGATIEQALADAYAQFETLSARSRAFSAQLTADAAASGDAKYAEVLSLAYRQVIASHKLVLDGSGKALFISKECFSNGCAATVDVTYPSIPMFLLYAPECVKGMLRPIFKYAHTDMWQFRFAPHDAGCYPLLNGQVYAAENADSWARNQMPVEECGNMVLCVAAVCFAEKSADFAAENDEDLRMWTNYLLESGLDPDNQLCTDDFAGHMPHNCNLAIKAIMAAAAYGELCRMMGRENDAARYCGAAREMAEKWAEMASNGDGSYRLGFDQPGTFSLKYNLVWDVLFGTGIFPKELIASEMKSYLAHLNAYGVPLDSRASYTKSDWLLYCAAMMDDPKDFAAVADSLWQAYNDSKSRVPMTDWYDTVTAEQRGFQHRSVQGGLFIRLLRSKGICRVPD